MKILIDIGHPGHVHLFRPFAQEMMKRGHKILFTCREKEFEIELLEAAGFDYISFGKKYKSTTGKILGLVKFDVREFITGLKFKPDIFLSHGSIYAAHASFLLKKLNICMEDTGNKEQVWLYKPFTKYILTPSVFPNLYGKKQIKYNAYHEIAYLHTNYFEPDPKIFTLMKNTDKKKYVILRFVSWRATHDIGKRGINTKVADRLIKLFEKNDYSLYISSEEKLPDKYEKYRINIPPQMFHNALYYASMVVADSQTVISEAGILGTPAIRFNDLVGTSHGYHHKELENKYGLIYNIHTKNEEKLFEVIEKLINKKDVKKEWMKKREALLKEKIDLTEYLVNFISNIKTF